MFSDLAKSREHPLIAAFFDHASDEIGALASLAQERFLGKVHHHPLGAGGDYRRDVGNQHLTGLGQRGWNLGDRQFAAADFLYDLLHVLCSVFPWPRFRDSSPDFRRFSSTIAAIAYRPNCVLRAAVL